MKTTLLKAFLCLAVFLATSYQIVSAQTTYYSKATGNWNAASTWTTSNTHAGPDAGPPTSIDNVIIGNGFTVRVTANATCATLQVGSSTANNAGTLDLNTAGVTLTVSGNVMTGGAGNTNRRGNITFSNATSALTAGSLTLGNPGGTPGQTNTITMTTGGTLTVGSLAVNPVTGNSFVAGAGLVQLTATNTLPNTIFTSFNDLTISSGTTTLSAGISIGGNMSIAGTLAAASNTVSFTKASGTQTLNSGGSTFFNVAHTAAGTLQLITNNLSIGGTFLNSAGTFNPNGLATSVTGLTTISGGTTVYTASTGTQTFDGGLTVSGGTFTGSTGTVSATDVTISSGTLTAPSGTFTVSGNWARTGGTFTPGSNTVTFTKASGTQTLNSGGTAFNNLSHTGAGTLQLTSNNLAVGGSFSNSGGDFDANNRTNTVTGLTTISSGSYQASTVLQTFTGGLTISGGTFAGSTGGVTASNVLLSTGTLSGPTGAFSVSGNWTQDGGTFTPGSGTVTFTGGSAQSINGAVSAQTFNNIIVSKTAGTTLTVGGNTTTLNTAAFTQTTGNFTAPSTFYATGALTLSAGTFTAGANTNLDGDFINNGGTFTSGTNTVTFGGVGSKTITGSASPIASFYDLVVNSGSVLFGNSNATRIINILDNFTISGGSFLSGSTAGGAHTINLTGNLQNDGTLDLSSNSATNHRLILLGSTKNISGGGTNTVYHLRMSTTGSANVNVNSNLRINGTLDWTADGLLILVGSDITFGTAGVVTAPSLVRYIQSDGISSVTGQVIKVNAGSTASWQFLFPIGTATNGYTPLDLTAATITNAPTVNSRLAVKTILSADAPGKLKRTFRLTVSGNGISTTFTNGRFNYVNPGDVSGSEPIASYTTLWYQKESNGIWTRPGGTAPGTVNTAPTLSFFTGPSAAQPLSNDTYYFTIGTPGAYGQTWYSYQTGNWDNPLSWTTDGSAFPLYANTTPGSIPGPADNVVITSGKTITVNVNNVAINGINVIGTLDLLASTGNAYTNISGTGRIKMAGSTDNFPTGTSTNFADNAVGGTLEINGGGISLNVARTFNNVVINMSANTNAAVLKSNYTINGDLTVTNGILQFEDLTVPANRNLIVNGNATVAASGGIRVAASNNRHEFDLYGDFVNSGVSYFTNRTAADYTGPEATDGIVDLNMRSPIRDQQIICNGVTRFYRLEINKGVDYTYKATITASAVANFNLFGKADYNTDTNQQATNANALGLIYGTVEIGTNVVIASLNSGTINYSVFEKAQLWVNGGSVSKIGDTSGNGAIVPYGKVRLSAGTLTADCGSGLTVRQAGIVQIDGGTLTSRVIRTSVLGVTAEGSYIQSGGDVILNGTTGGNGIQTSYAVFALTYPGNVFNMSGGTLTIKGPANTTDRGAIFINSDPGNISVTGGTVIFETNTNNAYRITSKAPFWNAIMRKTGGTATTIQLLGTTCGTGAAPDTQTMTIQPLVVLNDFTIEGTTAVTFLTNNADVTVGGNFEIKNGATYTPGTNTTTISSDGVSSLIFGNTAATQVFNNLTINKANATDEVVITTGNATALRVNGSLNVLKGIFNYGSFIASARGAVTLSSGVVVGKSTSTGKLTLDGTTNQAISSSSGTIHNLELSNTAGATLNTGGLTILRTLTLTSGIFNITTFKLTLNGASASIAGSGFGTTKMIQTSANNSDGGLELYLDTNKTLTFPLGVSGKYTPVTATFTSVTSAGLVKINPVNGVLQTTNLSGGADILSYYWRVGSSNFTVKPTVTYTFTYDQSDVGGVETNYVPGKVLDVSPFTRSSETPASKVNTVTNVATFNGSGSGFTLEDANYTVGGATRFTGSPRVLYSYYRPADGFADASSRDWRNGNNWTFGANGSFGVHDSRQVEAGDYPKAGDIAVMGWVPWADPNGNNGKPHGIAINNSDEAVAELRFSQMLSVTNNPTARVYSYNFQFRPTVCINNNGSQGQLLQGKVSGEGMFWIRSTGGNLSDPSFTNVDLGAFNLQDSSYVVYENTLGVGTYTNVPSAFPNLMMVTDGWGNQDKDSVIPKNILVNGSLELLGNINLVLNTGAAGDITVNRNLKFFRSNVSGNDSGGGGELRFGNTGTPRTVTVNGNLLLGSTYAAKINVGSPGTTPLTHTFNLGGNFVQNTTVGNGFVGGSSATNDRINVNLIGANSMTLTNAGGDAPQFYSLTVNKGSSIATTAAFNSNFSINGPTDQATKSLVLKNGLFIINNASVSVVLTSGGADFNIPSTAGLEVQAGTVRTTTTNTLGNITLDGLLRISGGTVTIDAGAGFPSSIEYSNSGVSAIELTAGTLTVGGQLRRSLTSSTGTLNYTQSAGTAIFGTRGFSTNTRGIFEVTNPGSQFNHSGGSFTIVQGNGSTSIPSLLINPGSSSITSGSTITVGNASTPATPVIGIQSTAILNNLTIVSSSATTTSMYITPLTVNGTLTVATGNTLNAQGLDLSIGGNFVVNGTYTSGNNTTSFINTGATAISGTTPALSFYNFTKINGGVLSLGKDITINRDLKVSSGTLATSSFAANLKRHAQIDATVTSVSGSGIIFNGTVQQQLTRSVSGTSTIGILTVNNSNGVIVPDGNDYNFTITNNLRLQSGVFDIGGGLLTLTTPALVTPVNPYSATNLIQTNSSFTDKGVRKQFPANYTTDFVFPVGQSSYTPVTFIFSGGNSSGSGTPTITVRPSNKIHPSIVNDDEAGELPDPVTFNDLNNVLQYYWIINASGISSTSFKSTMNLQYVQPLVAVTAPYSEDDYIAAQILSDPSAFPNNIRKFSIAEVNEVTNVITFNFTNVNELNINGEYLAGVALAIPSKVPTYTTVTSGNVGDNIYDQTVPGGIPSGSRVIVSPNHTVTFNTGSVVLYQTVLSAGAKIVIPSGSIGHSLGTLSGTGDLEIDSDDVSAVLPAAVYDTFFSCSGGGLIFGGSGTYEILGGITNLRNLTLNGSGVKSLANNNLNICNDFTINGGGFSNSSNRTITVQNDVLLNGGSVSNSAGTLTITRDLTQTSGSFDGGTGGTKTIGRNLSVSGGTFNPGSGTTNIIRVNGDMTVSGSATITTGSGGVTGQKFLFGGSGAQLLTGDFTGTRGFNRLEISNSAGLTIAGNTTINSQLLLTNGLITPNSILLLTTSAVAFPTVGSATSFVNGKLYKTLDPFTNFIFPIGKGSRWRTGAVLGVTQSGSVTWDMEYFAAAATGAIASAPAPRNNPVNNFVSSDASILRIASEEYWKVSDGSATSNGRVARVGLSWGIESDVSANLAQREALKVMSWNGTNWTNNGGTNFQPGGAHTQSRGTFESLNNLSFSENIVTLGSTETANNLPIELAWFKGEIVGSAGYLYWKTESELNNDYFEIQRSIDGKEFAMLGTVQGKGTTKQATDYTFEDSDLQLGKNYYRLKQYDLDGKISYSGVIVLEYTGITQLGMFVYPNPTRFDNINFKLNGANDQEIVIRLFDLTGKIVYKAVVHSSELSEFTRISTGDLKQGMYVLEAIQGKSRVTQRVIIKE